MDGAISLPVAFASFFMLPDLPDNTRAWYLNAQVGVSSASCSQVSSSNSLSDNKCHLIGPSTRLEAGGTHWPRPETTLHQGESGQDSVQMACLDPPSHDCVTLNLHFVQRQDPDAELQFWRRGRRRWAAVICFLPKSTQEPKIHDRADQQLSHGHGCSHGRFRTALCLDRRRSSQWRKMARHAILGCKFCFGGSNATSAVFSVLTMLCFTDHQSHLLDLALRVEHPGRLALGLLHTDGTSHCTGATDLDMGE